MTVKGIDVASYQSTTYATSGYAFVMVKATEGTGYTNPKHDDQVAHGRAAGLVVGHYHFIRPGSVSAQANYFLGKAKAKAGDLLVLDWEDSGVSGANKDAFLSYVDAKSPLRNVLYCNKSFWLNKDTTGRYGDGLWIADPDSAPGHPAIQAPWTFHQYAISGGMDQNVGNFATKADLVTWAKNADPAPPAPHNGGTVSTDTTNEEKLAGGLLAIGEVGTLDDSTPSGRQEHAQPYYVAKSYDVQKQILATLVEIRDALTQAPQALTGEQVEHARALTAPAADAPKEG
jgi:hypothetical protein